MSSEKEQGKATKSEEVGHDFGMYQGESTSHMRGDVASAINRDTRGTIEEASFQHLFTPVSADEVASTLQTLSVTPSATTAAAASAAGAAISSSGMSSCADSTSSRRDVVTPPVGAMGSIGGAAPSIQTTISGVTATSNAVLNNGGVTPELSPSLLASLRGSSSPSHSQVSVGSVGPALTSASLTSLSGNHKYDLTPVMRNTSSDLYCDTKDDSVMTITPSSQEGYLHGEHLAFPSDFSSTSASSHSIPPLQPVHHHLHHHPLLRTSNLGLGGDSSSGLEGDLRIQRNRRASAGETSHQPHPHGLDLDLNIPAPLQLPSSRKYYSFTTRKQYEEACLQDSDDDLYNRSDSDDDCPPALASRLVPYAPRSRPANFDIERVPDEELRRIFNTRDTNSNAAAVSAVGGGGGSSNDQGHHHPYISLAEIPLEQRVPSLHMANNLHGSTTSVSYTDHEDEDSVLHLRDNDDASLSSRGSSLYLPNEEDMLRSSAAATRNPDDPMSDDAIVDDEVFLLLQRKQRKRKQRKKEQRAVEWLQSVEADQNVVAEAASSKFLTSSSPVSTLRRQPSPAIALSRQISSPSTLLTSPPS